MRSIQNESLQLDIDEKTLTLSVRDLRNGKVWRMREDGLGDIGVKGHCGPYQTFMFSEAKHCEWVTLSKTSIQATLTGWPYTAHVWCPLELGLVVKFTIKDDALTVDMSPHNNDAYEASIIDSFYPRGLLFPEKSSGDLVMPYSQGCLLDKDSKLELDMVLPGYVGIGFVMPWWGQLCGDGAAMIALADTPDDLGFRVHCDGGGKGATVSPYWQASLGGFKYKRIMNYKFFEKSSVMELAKAYRKHAEEQGQAITLREKMAERPAVDNLIGGPHMHLSFMATFDQHDSQSCVHFMRFSQGLERYRKLWSLAGIGKKGLAHIDGWGRDGYDYNHPEVMPPDIRLGSWDGLRKLRDGIRELGHSVLLHDNYVDYYKHTNAYKNDEGVMNMDGLKHAADEWLGGSQEWLCSTKALKYMRSNFDELVENDCDVDGFYLDCWSIGHLRECYDQKHLATRSLTRKSWTEALAFCYNRNYVVGSESGNDWAVPVMDYCHTVQPDVIPHILSDKISSFGKAIPLYNMVWHDCVVCPAWISQDRTKPAVVKDGLVIPERRDIRLWALLWGGPPAFRTKTMHYGNFTEKDFECDAAFIASLKPIWEFNGNVGYEPIVEWEMLSPDSASQKTVFGNGSEAEVDFNSGRYKLKIGKKTIEGRFE